MKPLPFLSNLYRHFPWVNQPKPEFGVAIGVNLGYSLANDQAKVEQIAALGVTWVRMVIAWDWIEPQRGAYDWAGFLGAVDAFNNSGLSVLLVTARTMNPVYNDPSYPDPPDLGGLHVPVTQTEINDYANFHALAAKMLGNRSVMYELCNESYWIGYTGTQYAALMKATAPPIRANYSGSNRKCTILGTGIVMDHMQFVQDCIDAGAFDYLDGCAVHPYGYGQPGSAFRPMSQLASDYATLRAMFAPRYPAMPIYATELGYSTSGDLNWDAFTPADQAKVLQQHLTIDRSAGIPLTIWYEYSDNAQAGATHEQGFGLVDSSYVPKPSYTALQRFLRPWQWPPWPPKRRSAGLKVPGA